MGPLRISLTGSGSGMASKTGFSYRDKHKPGKSHEIRTNNTRLFTIEVVLDP